MINWSIFQGYYPKLKTYFLFIPYIKNNVKNYSIFKIWEMESQSKHIYFNEPQYISDKDSFFNIFIELKNWLILKDVDAVDLKILIVDDYTAVIDTGYEIYLYENQTFYKVVTGDDVNIIDFKGSNVILTNKNNQYAYNIKSKELVPISSE